MGHTHGLNHAVCSGDESLRGARVTQLVADRNVVVPLPSSTCRNDLAQRVEVRLTDDLSGAEIRPGQGETVTFSLDGTSYEIDLTAKNASALRKALRPYIEAGRPIKSSRRRPVRTKVASDTRAVKEWARANGYQVRDRGRVRGEILAAFEAAN